MKLNILKKIIFATFSVIVSSSALFAGDAEELRKLAKLRTAVGNKNYTEVITTSSELFLKANQNPEIKKTSLIFFKTVRGESITELWHTLPTNIQPDISHLLKESLPMEDEVYRKFIQCHPDRIQEYPSSDIFKAKFFKAKGLQSLKLEIDNGRLVPKISGDGNLQSLSNEDKCLVDLIRSGKQEDLLQAALLKIFENPNSYIGYLIIADLVEKGDEEAEKYLSRLLVSAPQQVSEALKRQKRSKRSGVFDIYIKGPAIDICEDHPYVVCAATFLLTKIIRPRPF